MFQSIPIGELVELTVCRGYPLSIDPNDPNIEIKPLPAINRGSRIDETVEEFEDIYVSIVKGPKGFGFTIADDALSTNQKVKQIFDQKRCARLMEDDLLMQINGVILSGFSHSQVVDVLKQCQIGQETVLRLRRRINSNARILNGDTNDFLQQQAQQFDFIDKGKRSGIMLIKKGSGIGHVYLTLEVFGVFSRV